MKERRKTSSQTEKSNLRLPSRASYRTSLRNTRRLYLCGSRIPPGNPRLTAGMQEPRIPYAQSQALGNLRYSTPNPGARDVTDQKPDSFVAAAFLKPGNEHAALLVQCCRDVSEGIAGADANWLSKRRAAVTGQDQLSAWSVLGLRVPGDRDPDCLLPSRMRHSPGMR